VIVLASGAAVLAIIAVSVAAALILARPSVRVPSFVGVTKSSASQRAGALGLTLVVKGTEVSADVPAGSIASQEPSAGILVASGSQVTVLLSAGSDTFPLPDVTGMTLADARAALRAKGLDVLAETAPSSAPTGTVTASEPTPGTKVAEGDVVRLTVSAAGAATQATDLSSNSFVLDPAPPASDTAVDISFEVSTRLAERLRAAGAQVTLTRLAPGASGSPSESGRVMAAQAASATVIIGFSVASTGLEGLQVLTMPRSGVSPDVFAASAPLADAVFSSLRVDFATVSTLTATADRVLIETGLAGLRIRLGSLSVRSDRALFADPKWADIIASDTFRGIAGLYGRAQ
jgi:beta-lactam-binding protein with PASTA domain